MIQEFFLMNGYGVYVWSAFSFTLVSFSILYLIVKTQYAKEKKRFNSPAGLKHGLSDRLA